VRAEHGAVVARMCLPCSGRKRIPVGARNSPGSPRDHADVSHERSERKHRQVGALREDQQIRRENKLSEPRGTVYRRISRRPDRRCRRHAVGHVSTWRPVPARRSSGVVLVGSQLPRRCAPCPKRSPRIRAKSPRSPVPICQESERWSSSSDFEADISCSMCDGSIVVAM